MSLTKAQAEFLVDTEAASPLQETTEGFRKGASSLQLRSKLEKRFEPSQCRAILDCAQSRIRHGHKFEEPSQWFLTSTAAEQASHHLIGSWRAQELAKRCESKNLIEVGCGVGGDTVQLSKRFQVTAYEKDPARAVLAAHNLAINGVRGSSILEQEANLDKLSGGLLYCDPARRTHERLSSPEDWIPPLSSLAERCSEFDLISVKAAPGLKLETLKTPGLQYEVDFLSLRGEMKEALLYLRAGDRAPQSRAILLGFEKEVIVSRSDFEAPVENPQPGQYLLNPDPAILRAGHLNSLAEMVWGHLVHNKIGYLCSPEPAPSHLADSFLVEEASSLNWSRLKKRLRSLPWTDFEYLGRGVPFSQPEVRQKLGKLKRKRGQESLRGAVIIYRHDTDYRVVLAKRI